MTPCMRRSALIVLIISLALPAWGQQYFLYAPQPATSGQKNSTKDGILVEEIEVHKGDSLYSISRKFSGHGMYFPQILLFNSIHNPSLIYPGKMLKVPVTKGAPDSGRSGAAPSDVPRKSKSSAHKVAPKIETKSAPVRPASAAKPGTESSPAETKTAGMEKTKANRPKRQTALQTNKKVTTPNPLPAAHERSTEVAPETNSVAGQKLFEAATKAYRKDDCRTALELFDRYLADNSNSPLAADANLYKAECYLKLSAQ